MLISLQGRQNTVRQFYAKIFNNFANQLFHGNRESFFPRKFLPLKYVIVYNDRVVAPSSLRTTVLDVLHSAHQGASTMALRVRATGF